MKKALLLLIALAFGFGLKAQCPYTQAMDFTATDIHGTEVHLFDILDGGQAVLIDFFFTTCGPCQQACPKIVESYTAFGCNMHDVFFMEIDTGDSDAACLNWVNTYGVEYPTISGVGGGTNICSQYGINYYPTVILIMPDHSIVIQDLYPIPNAQTVITQLEAHGLQQHDCDEPSIYEETLTFDTDTLWFDNDNSILYIYNNTEEPVVHLNKITIDTDMPWFYFLYGNQEIQLGEEFDIPIAQEQSIQLEVLANVWVKEMIYPVLSFENTLETVTLVTAFEDYTGIQETAASVTLFPNPAHESVTVKGENLGTVRVFNALGQQMDEFEANGSELRINTTSYENGIYFIKAGETTLRFVVTH